MELLLWLFVIGLDFIITAFCFWLITVVLSCMGLAIAFSWGWAFGFWLITKILKLLF